jgi:hypothetical protein
MRSKNSKPLTNSERDHLGRVKELACSVCSAPGPSEAHHINQGQHYTCVALCVDCHRGSENGWHGRKALWRVMKMDELDALAVTIQRLMENSNGY